MSERPDIGPVPGIIAARKIAEGALVRPRYGSDPEGNPVVAPGGRSGQSSRGRGEGER